MLRINIIRKLLRVLARYEIKHQHFAIGLNSYVDKEREMHIIMLDYDVKDLSFVLNDCNELTAFWHLSDYEVYKTHNGHHVFFWFDIVPYSRLKMIIDYSKCDTAYKYISKFYEYKTIRATGKYKTPDIQYVGRFSGKRTPTKEERGIGELKKKEYELLKQQLFKAEVLK